MSKFGKILRTAWIVALCVAGALLGSVTGYHNAGYTGAIALGLGGWIIGAILGMGGLAGARILMRVLVV
jgi:Mg/Co/Ni transporter MgtE